MIAYTLRRQILTNVLQGIRFHGLTIPDCQEKLPPAPGGKEIIAESMLWLLMTGQVPTAEQTRQLSRELAEKGDLPAFVEQLVDSCVNLPVYSSFNGLANMLCEIAAFRRPCIP